MKEKIEIEKCVYCKGTGIVLEWGKHERTCNSCQGSGKVYIRSFIKANDLEPEKVE